MLIFGAIDSTDDSVLIFWSKVFQLCDILLININVESIDMNGIVWIVGIVIFNTSSPQYVYVLLSA